MILLVEDNKDIRENFAELLALEGFDIETADRGDTGLEIALLRQPEVIICDIHMPGLDGYEVLKALMENKETANIPFIFTSSSSENVDVKKGLSLGAKFFFVKPFDEYDVIKSIKICLADSLEKLSQF